MGVNNDQLLEITTENRLEAAKKRSRDLSCGRIDSKNAGCVWFSGGGSVFNPLLYYCNNQWWKWTCPDPLKANPRFCTWFWPNWPAEQSVQTYLLGKTGSGDHPNFAGWDHGKRRTIASGPICFYSFHFGILYIILWRSIPRFLCFVLYGIMLFLLLSMLGRFQYQHAFSRTF